MSIISSGDIAAIGGVYALQNISNKRSLNLAPFDKISKNGDGLKEYRTLLVFARSATHLGHFLIRKGGSEASSFV